MQLQKITNPLWLPAIAPRVDEFVKEINSPAVSYQSLFMYFQQAVQYGKNFTTNNEFWVVLKGEEPKAFAHWYVCGLPMAGTVFCDYTYSWAKDKKLNDMLMEQFIKFGKQNRCPNYKGLCIDEKRYRFFRALFNKHGISLKRQSYVHCMGR